MSLPRLLLLLGALAGAGCGSLPELPPVDAGRACATDSDCVANACCGEGTGAIHRLDGPDCSTVRCSGACPLTQVRCGCGLPVCRDGFCSVAVSAEPRCE